MDNREVKWKALLEAALLEPGKVMEGYRAFHEYSIGNQVLASVQCWARGLQVGPIATYPGWQAKGRQVKRGEKAIGLWMPITSKKRKEEAEEGQEEAFEVFTRFIWRNQWFVLSQTEGEEIPSSPVPGFDIEKALTGLNVKKVEFTEMNGNVQGYAEPGRKVAISPVAQLPLKTLFHELGHILLGHCEEGKTSDGELTPRNLREVEAESVALLVCASLGLPGIEYSRGYIQGWAGFSEMPEKSIQKIFKAADQIIKAGEVR